MAIASLSGRSSLAAGLGWLRIGGQLHVGSPRRLHRSQQATGRNDLLGHAGDNVRRLLCRLAPLSRTKPAAFSGARSGARRWTARVTGVEVQALGSASDHARRQLDIASSIFIVGLIFALRTFFAPRTCRSSAPVHERQHLFHRQYTVLVGVHSLEDFFVSRLKL
jgi:hypothetical protein